MGRRGREGGGDGKGGGWEQNNLPASYVQTPNISKMQYEVDGSKVCVVLLFFNIKGFLFPCIMTTTNDTHGMLYVYPGVNYTCRMLVFFFFRVFCFFVQTFLTTLERRCSCSLLPASSCTRRPTALGLSSTSSHRY